MYLGGRRPRNVYKGFLRVLTSGVIYQRWYSFQFLFD